MVALVLAADDLVGVERQQGAEDLGLLLHQRARLQRRRRLHRHDAHDLQQVGDDHVPERARLLVERAARPDRELLRHVDLDVVDVLAVPQRLQEAVGEPQGEHVERRLLAQEVVDAEDLVLAEDLVHGRVQGARRLEVGAERLLHDHARALGEARLAERVDDRPGGRGRHGEVVEPARLRPDGLLGLRHGVGQRVGPRGHVGEPLAERPPLVVAEVEPAELPQRLAGEAPAELVLAQLVQRRADDAELLGQQPGLPEVEEPGDELAAREVARRAEQHDHMGIRARQSLPRALAPEIRCLDRHGRHPALPGAGSASRRSGAAPDR